MGLENVIRDLMSENRDLEQQNELLKEEIRRFKEAARQQGVEMAAARNELEPQKTMIGYLWDQSRFLNNLSRLGKIFQFGPAIWSRSRKYHPSYQARRNW